MGSLIDASSLIEAKDRYYAFDLCPGFWAWIEQQHAAGELFSIDKIGAELEAGTDDLAPWAKARRTSFFLPVDEETLRELRAATTWVMGEDFRPAAKAEFLRGADPFLISFAIAHKFTIVTDETFVAGQLNKVKIPAVCRQFNVDCIHPLDALRRSGAQFVLGPPLPPPPEGEV